MAEDDAFTLLTTARDNVEAMSIRSVLESEGIDVFVQGEHHRALEGMLGAFVDLRVMVRRSQLDDARELLEEAAYAEHLEAEPVQADEVEDASIHRFVERSPEPAETDDDASLEPTRRRHPALAVLLALVIPIGMGHIYAGRRLIGAIVGSLLLIDWVLMLRGWDVSLAVLGLLAFDAIGGALAARRPQAK